MFCCPISTPPIGVQFQKKPAAHQKPNSRTNTGQTRGNNGSFECSPCGLGVYGVNANAGSNVGFYPGIVQNNTYAKVYFTHWGRVTHICVGNQTTIGSDNGLSPDRRQAIIWTITGILLIGPLGTNFSEISIEINLYIVIQANAFQNIVWKMAAILSRPQCVNEIFSMWDIRNSYRPSREVAILNTWPSSGLPGTKYLTNVFTRLFQSLWLYSFLVVFDEVDKLIVPGVSVHIWQ